MASPSEMHPLAWPAWHAGNPRHSKALRAAGCMIVLLLCSLPACAQFQQPFVFSTAGAVMTRNDQTGVLTPVAGSPFAPALLQTLDVQGRFLFGLGTNSIHMYQVNSTTGAFSEVPNSPFASVNTNEPGFIAVEPTGQYIAVVNRASPSAGQGSIETFRIDSANLALVPVSGSFQELDSTVIGTGIDHLNRRFYVFLAPNPNNPQIQLNSELNNYGIDPQTGFVTGNSFLVGSEGRCFTMDPQGRFLVVGIGRIAGIIGILPIAADTGIPGGTFTETSVGLGSFPNEISTEVTGNFIYLTYLNSTNPPVHIFAIDPQTQVVTETASSPLPGFTSVPALMPDPTGPFMYQSDATGTSVQAYTTDPLTGYFTAVAGTTISAAGANGFYVFSIPPGQQNLVGPEANLAPSALSLGSITVGTPSPAQGVLLTSTGDQGLSVNSISIGGANANEFSERDNCQVPTVLQPTKSCTIFVMFTPTATGLQQATLTVTDNAPGSPQLVQLSGTGVTPPPPKPAVTLMPGSISFQTITQGTTSAPSLVTVTNAGNADLHVTSVVVGGNNPNDFSSTNNCAGTISAGSSCAINVTFAPLAAGERSETITLTDDAADSPQVIAPGGSTAVTVAAGQTAQFAMQITPGTGFAGNVSLTCSGAPLGATCQAPASVAVSNGAVAAFTVVVKTSGGAMAPVLMPPEFVPWPGMGVLPLLLLWLGLLKRFHRKQAAGWRALPGRAAFASVIVAALLAGAFSAAGCGGGTAATAPPTIVTPQGSTVLTVTPSAMSTSGKALQLQPIQLTLTVK
jgi:hypothetical protein